MTARLALFDCDGTLADSQHDIASAMRAAFAQFALPAPDQAMIRSIIGLNVDRAIAVLAPDLAPDAQEELGDAYRDAYFTARTAHGSAPEPLYAGIIDALDTLIAQGWVLGIATGKSARGLNRLLVAHGIAERFATLQTADSHPSKPDPAMARAAMAETGIAAARTVVIGDTGYDMAMAHNAGAYALGVDWGYQSADDMRRHGAAAIATTPADLPAMLAEMLGDEG